MTAQSCSWGPFARTERSFRPGAVDSAGQELWYEIPTGTLELVQVKFPIVERTAALIGSGDFRQLSAAITRELDSAKRELIVGNLETLQPEYGSLKSVHPAGFVFYEEGGRTKLHLSAILEREKRNHSFSVDVYPEPGKDGVLLLNYQFRRSLPEGIGRANSPIRIIVLR